MYCQECRAELPEGAIFCSRCGNRVLEAEAAGSTAQQPRVPTAGAQTRSYPGLEKSGRGWLITFIVILALVLGGAGIALAVLAFRPGGSGELTEMPQVATEPAQSPLLTTTTPSVVLTCRELAPGCEAVVANVGEVGLRLREEPSASSQTKETLHNGAKVCITGQGVQADGINWWPVRLNLSGATLEGWSAGTDPTTGEGPYLTATGEPCE